MKAQYKINLDYQGKRKTDSGIKIFQKLKEELEKSFGADNVICRTEDEYTVLEVL